MKVETIALPTSGGQRVEPGSLILHMSSGMDIWMVTHVEHSQEGIMFDVILVCPAKDTANYYGMTNTFLPCLCRLYDGEVRLKQKL
ncbi:hypothetical protein KNV38_gp080 [uncultured phage cr111_1]|uniref:Uncharacterized protein n=1 Tax=uncultured phage cr111_1 TaxID=2772071 RepID=A0A7M1S1J1_9CAUD|nr:hypothetical protein KNV38_gp080 [uncultured phage cr111_1]QOR59200.1 hypothetical protein [uncultured phage cr111_1]